VVLKPLRLGDFFVENLSGFEHNLENNMQQDDPKTKAKQAMLVHSVATNIVAQKCAPWTQLNKERKNASSLDYAGSSSVTTTLQQQPQKQQQRQRSTWVPSLASLALIPFYGGPPETFGNAHSTSSRKIKLLQTKGAVCAAAALFRWVKVGVCADGPDGAADAQGIESFRFDFVEVVPLQCGHGARLPFVFLREAQVRMVRARQARRKTSSSSFYSQHDPEKSLSSWDPDVVFFTEADQVKEFDWRVPR